METISFTFDKRIYKQEFGTPMGSPLSPIIADLIMKDLERFGHEVPFYYRYDLLYHGVSESSY